MIEYETVEVDFETPEDERILEVDVDADEIDLGEIRRIGEQFDAELNRMARGDPWWPDVSELEDE